MGPGLLKRYVVGFMFTEDRQQVLLIRKAKTRDGLGWMLGRLNGIGGMLAEKENPFLAMSREFEEETGLFVNPLDWQWCGRYARQDSHEVIAFRLFSDAARKETQSSDEGSIFLHRVDEVPFLPHVDNLRWLLPLLLKHDLTTFSIEE